MSKKVAQMIEEAEYSLQAKIDVERSEQVTLIGIIDQAETALEDSIAQEQEALIAMEALLAVKAGK